MGPRLQDRPVLSDYNVVVRLQGLSDMSDDKIWALKSLFERFIRGGATIMMMVEKRAQRELYIARTVLGVPLTPALSLTARTHQVDWARAPNRGQRGDVVYLNELNMMVNNNLMTQRTNWVYLDSDQSVVDAAWACGYVARNMLSLISQADQENFTAYLALNRSNINRIPLNDPGVYKVQFAGAYNLH
jgi:hypothetical protein